MIETKQILVASLVLVTAIVGGWFLTANIRDDDAMQDVNNLDKGMDKPILWIYVNDSDVNSRYWSDFGARSSRVLNVPFLNICYERTVKANAGDYRIEVISGLADLAVRLGGWEALPTPLRNAQTVVREPELNWIRATVLAKWGGLWVAPSTVFLKPMGPLPKDKVVFFGTDDDVTLAGKGGTPVPALRVVWSPEPSNPLWVTWEQKVRDRLERRSGGSEFRHDEKSDTADAIHQYANSVDVRPGAELARHVSGKRIQLEDILAAGQEGTVPFKLGDAVYMPVPWPEILERRAFGWFLRLSEDQILNSDLAITWVLHRVIG
jgi:hypothetical protein